MRSRKVPFKLVHSGQHYDSNLSDVFFRELSLPAPDINLKVGSGSQARQTAEAMVRLEQSFLDLEPDLVLVQGDTNTVLATALTAAKLGIKVGHIEAGLRSYDMRMPEEHNRRLTDHLSSYLFAPTERALETLRKESCWGEMMLTGNTIIDACILYGGKVERRSSILEKVPDRFALATIHRAENVDDSKVLNELVQILSNCPIPVVYATHPRTLQRLKSQGLEDTLMGSRNVTVVPPSGYLEFLALLKACRFVISDSGGVQEEVTAPNVRKKVFVLRKSTERPEAVEAGFAEVLGTNTQVVLRRLRKFLQEKWIPPSSSPFGDGHSSRRIVTKIEELGEHPLSEPIAVC